MTEEIKAPQLRFIRRRSGVYFSPGETFADIGRAAGVALPLILLLALTVGSALVTTVKLPMEKFMNEEVDRMVEEGRVSPEQAEAQREQMAKIAPYTRIITPVTAAIFIVILTLAIAGVAKLVTMMMGIESRFAPLWSVTIYAFLAVSIISVTLATPCNAAWPCCGTDSDHLTSLPAHPGRLTLKPARQSTRSAVAATLRRLMASPLPD